MEHGPLEGQDLLSKATSKKNGKGREEFQHGKVDAPLHQVEHDPVNAMRSPVPEAGEDH